MRTRPARIAMFFRHFCLITVLVATGCTEPPGHPDGPADHLFLGARAYTLDAERPWAEAVAVRDDRIVYVGDAAGAAQFKGPDTRIYDGAGKMLLPGFIDAHMHPVAGGAYATALSLDTFGTVEDWVRAIENHAAANPDAPVLFGYGFLASTFGPVGPTRQLIDAVVPDRPVLIMDEGFHGAWGNTEALRRLGIDKDTPDPVAGFSYYKRDANGAATGYFLEGTASMAMDGLDVITEEIVTQGTKIIFGVMNSYGVTSAFDAGAIGYEDMLTRVLERLAADGDMTVRLVGSYRPEGPEDLNVALERAEQWGERVRGENYHYRTLKIMDDGTVEGRTAAMFEDYQGEPGNSGETVFTQAQLTQLVSGAAGRGIDVHIHALGERAIHEALNSIEAARGDHPQSQTRFTICHIQVIADNDLKRFAELDVIAQSTPLWAAYDTYGKQFVSEDQFDRYWRFNSLHKLGVRLTFGSDFPASGAGTLGISPVFNIEIGNTRQDPGDASSRIQPRESERLAVETLIRGYTIDAAYQLQMEDEIGSLEVGKKADLVVLDRNLFDSDPYAISTIKVLLTMLDGKLVYEQPE